MVTGASGLRRHRFEGTEERCRRLLCGSLLADEGVYRPDTFATVGLLAGRTRIVMVGLVVRMLGDVSMDDRLPVRVRSISPFDAVMGMRVWRCRQAVNDGQGGNAHLQMTPHHGSIVSAALAACQVKWSPIY